MSDPLGVIDDAAGLLERIGYGNEAADLRRAWANLARLVEANVRFDAAEWAVLTNPGGGPFADKSAVMGEAKLHLKACIEAVAGPLDRTVKRRRK